MHKLKYAEIKKLLSSTAKAPAVTIYLPTHKAFTPQNMNEDQIRFKNLYTKALELLESRDKHSEFNTEFKRICTDLLNDKDFWQNVSESLLLCVRPGKVKYFHLPVGSEEYVAVADHFHLSPVLGLRQDLVEYYVLAVAQHHPFLLKGDAYGLTFTDVKLPQTIEAALGIDEMHQKSIQFSGVRGSTEGEFHGHGSAKDTGDAERLQFFKIIDETINKKIGDKKPLILAGVEAEIAEYRPQSNYPNIVEPHIEGSFTKADADILHPKAQVIIQEQIITPAHKQVLETYQQLRGQASPKAVETTPELKDAAKAGKIATLLLGMSKVTQDNTRQLIFPDDSASQAIDYVAQQVVSQSGEVITVAQDEMPGNKLMLAINRY
jgi:hypothetical protein